MASSDMVIFNEQVQSVATEVIAQEVEKFGAASASTLVLGSRNVLGDFSEEASYQLISGLVNRRNAYGSGAVASTTLQEMLDRAVKVDGRVGPVDWTKEQFKRILSNEELAGLVVGEQSAKGMMADHLNTACLTMVAAATNVGAAVVHDGTASVGDLNVLNKGAALFGDRSQSIAAWLMHSKVWHDLVDKAITNANRLYTINNINVFEDGLGRRYVVFDSPSLVTAGSPDTYHTLGLVPGAVQVETTQLDSESVPIVGEENLSRKWQGEYSFVLGLKGYAWDAANGGKSPNDTALGTGTNWDQLVTSVKDTAGGMVNTQ